MNELFGPISVLVSVAYLGQGAVVGAVQVARMPRGIGMRTGVNDTLTGPPDGCLSP